MSHKYKVISYVFVIVIFSLLLRNIFSNLSMVENLSIKIFDINFFLMLIFLISIYFVNVFSWHYMLALYGFKLGFRKNFKIWILSNASRLIPGSIWQYPSRVFLLTNEGVSKSIGISAVTFEAILTLFVGSATAVIYYVFLKFSLASFNNLIPILVILLTLICTFTLNSTIKIVKNLVNLKFTIELPSLNVKSSAILATLFYLRFVTVGGFLFFLIDSLSIVSEKGFLDIIWVYSVSWIVGFLSFFAPGGIGVTEGSISILLSQTIPLSLTSLISIAFRLGLFIVEISIIAIILLGDKLKKVD